MGDRYWLSNPALPAVLGMLCLHSAAEGATRYVSQLDTAAADSGEGDVSTPYKSLAYAMQQLQPGDTLVIKAGVYRETMDFRLSPAGGEPPSGQRTVIEGAPGDDVVIKPSDVVGAWESAGNGVFVRHGWVHNSQQVYLDGVPLTQVGGQIFGGFPGDPEHALAKSLASTGGIWPGRLPGGLARLVGNSFYYDIDARKLYIKLSLPSLDGHVIEAGVRTFGVFGTKLKNVTIRNLKFLHGNTTTGGRVGVVTLNGDNLVVDGVQITYSDGTGLVLSGNDNLITNTTARFCGQLGFNVQGSRLRVIGNETSSNNTRGFNPDWEAGGAKFTGSLHLQDSEIANHKAFFNNGDGIWVDYGNTNNKIHDNIVAYNRGNGIHYEASFTGYIYNNFVFVNGLRGIHIPHSSDSVIAQNLVIGNRLEGIAVLDSGRRDESGLLDLQPKNDRVIGNIVGWNEAGAVLLPEDLQRTASDYNYFVDAGPYTNFVFTGRVKGRAVKTLGKWQEISNQDMHSRRIARGMPRRLFEALCSQSLAPDWNRVRSLAAEVVVVYDFPRWSDIPPLIRTSSTPGPVPSG